MPNGKIIYAFIADPGNGVLHPHLFRRAKKWAAWAEKRSDDPPPCDVENLAQSCAGALVAAPYMYKDPEELDERYT